MSDALDCTTPRGQLFIARQHEIIATCARTWNADAVHTADDTASAIDALFSRGGRLGCLAEVKARDLTLTQLRDFGSYLVTFDKLVTGRDLAARLRVPYWLIVGLTDAIVYWRIADPFGRWLVALTVERTPTQATCNGGDIVRANAYLSLDTMRELGGG